MGGTPTHREFQKHAVLLPFLGAAGACVSIGILSHARLLPRLVRRIMYVFRRVGVQRDPRGLVVGLEDRETSFTTRRDRADRVFRHNAFQKGDQSKIF